MAIDWLDLDSPPALPGLFLRAALRHGVRGRHLPDLGLRCRLEVDPRHLARYRQVCGIAESAYLPPVYPHLLAFALQMQLLTDRRFPFPLLGLVHLENRIRVLRPLGGLGPFQVGVQLADLQPHDKGASFSLITHLEDQLGLLWEGDSRILCRALRLDGAPPPRTEQAPLDLAPLADWSAPADTGRRYARVAGDYNPIHLSALSARLFGFPRAIAHGLWNKARSLAELHAHLPLAGFAVEVRFQKPVLLPAHVTLQASQPGSSGQFRLLGAGDVPHMAGIWQPLRD
ncbi:MaoC/PaaZ C-terminal domain-containing protein [Pseudomonas sp. SP16.1]|uniref:MaoC/PaaZ C-terminal domain-containing protein n=1 Tax=Pseudomonas sp. SP16.1 TaxID=3458854 RepID=UPI0040455EF0